MESKSAGVNSGIHLRKRTPFVAVSILNSFRTGAQRRKKRVIPVQDGRPAFFQPAEDLAFGAQDVFPAAEIADVGVSHIRDHRHVGLRDADQIVDLAQMIHPHRLPAVLRVRYFDERTDATMSFVVVLPTLPVTATTGIPSLRR